MDLTFDTNFFFKPHKIALLRQCQVKLTSNDFSRGALNSRAEKKFTHFSLKKGNFFEGHFNFFLQVFGINSHSMWVFHTNILSNAAERPQGAT